LFHVEHGYRAAPAALESRRSKPGIITATDLTEGRIDLFKTPTRSALEVKKPQMSRLYRLIPVVGLVMSARTRWSGMFLTTQPLMSSQNQLRVTRGLPALF
jgi:hypothetical protein